MLRHQNDLTMTILDVKKYRCPSCQSGSSISAVSSPAPEKPPESQMSEVSIDDVIEHREERFDTDSEMADSEKVL